MIRYLREIRNVAEIKTHDMYRIGNNFEPERYDEVYRWGWNA